MAYSFSSASSQHLNIGPNVAVVSGPPFTVACWASPAGNASVENLIAFGNTSLVNPLFILRLRGDVAGDPVEVAHRDDSGSAVTASTGSFSPNTWQHFAGVFASASSRTAFFDGVGGTPNTTTLSATTLNTTGVAAWIRTGPFNPFSGAIAEVGIWNEALNAAEIASLAKGISPQYVRPQNLVLYAPMVRELRDFRAGRAITNVNGATVSAHPRVYT